jgi:hypothetical protein
MIHPVQVCHLIELVAGILQLVNTLFNRFDFDDLEVLGDIR